ncbi:MAG: class I SAM-dependent methyltransferase [Burkholderiales bacterium]|nr:class I SAM-dependent methyltransferase [Burkholderiales bacterium]
MMQSLRQRYRDEQFQPTWLGVLVNPFFLARLTLWRHMQRFGGSMRGKLLDVGCGSQPYRQLFHGAQYVGLDIDTPTTRARGLADVFYDGLAFPVPDADFECVLCSQVLEHVFTPDDFLSEIYRVMQPGGRLLLTVPFVWDEHEQPYDFARYSSFGLRALLERNGFRVIEQHKLMADASMFFQLAIAYLWKVIPGRSVPRNVLVTLILAAPLSLLGLLASALLPQNPDLFLDQLVLAEKPASA